MAKRGGNSARGASLGGPGKAAGTSASGDKPRVDSSGRGGGQNPSKGSQGYAQGRAPDFGSLGRG